MAADLPFPSGAEAGERKHQEAFRPYAFEAEETRLSRCQAT